MSLVDRYIEQGQNKLAIEQCEKEGRVALAKLLRVIFGEQVNFSTEITGNFSTNEAKNKVITITRTEPKIIPSFPSNLLKVQLLCNWCPSKDLSNLWEKMSQGGGRWGRVQIVDSNPDYYVIINAVIPGTVYNPRKTVIFRMEPRMKDNPQRWGEWADPENGKFLRVFRHERGDYNNNEWHLGKTYQELSTMIVRKNQELSNTVSTVLSGQYRDPGHVKRIDFVRFLEKKLDVHVYGDNRWNYKNYKGKLPPHCKDEGLFPYKYTFNGENHATWNYYTEKLIDGILAECLTFYWGCPNVKDFIDERAYVQLYLSNFEQDYQTIEKAIKEDWHTQRLPYIREAKKKILNELQFFPRLEKLLTRRELNIILYNGLCNRLIPLCSALRLSKIMERKVNVLWTSNPNRTCIAYIGPSCDFSELFLPLEGVDFLSEGEMTAKKDTCSCHDYNFFHTDPLRPVPNESKDLYIDHALSILREENMVLKDIEKYNFDKPGLFRGDDFSLSLKEYFKLLQPLPELKKIIDTIAAKFVESKKMIGLHLRRSDGSFAQKDWFHTDKALRRAVSEWQRKGYTIFLATDDKKYEDKFESVITQNEEKKYENSANGAKYGLVDLFLLSKCQNIVSTVGSSFGFTAYSLSESSRLWYVSEDENSVKVIDI